MRGRVGCARPILGISTQTATGTTGPGSAAALATPRRDRRTAWKHSAGRRARTVADSAATLSEPVLRRLGHIAGSRDIDVPILAEWVARVVLTMVMAPPAAPPEVFLREVLRPLLAVTGDQG